MIHKIILSSVLNPFCLHILFIYSSLAQSVERMTVNHDVAGSSPAGGATKETLNVYQTFRVSFYAKIVVLYAFSR